MEIAFHGWIATMIIIEEKKCIKKSSRVDFTHFRLHWRTKRWRKSHLHLLFFFFLFSRRNSSCTTNACRSILVCQWISSCTSYLALWIRYICFIMFNYRHDFQRISYLRFCQVSIQRSTSLFLSSMDLTFRNNALRKPRNYFLINLAITDLGLLLTNNSLHVISSFKQRWIFGQAGRRIALGFLFFVID